jgi:hypothetical protein
MHHPESTGLSRIRGYAVTALAQVEIDLRNRHRTMRSISAGGVVYRPGSALLRAQSRFLRGVRALPRGDTWPHMVEMPAYFYDPIYWVGLFKVGSIRG